MLVWDWCMWSGVVHKDGGGCVIHQVPYRCQVSLASLALEWCSRRKSRQKASICCMIGALGNGSLLLVIDLTYAIDLCHHLRLLYRHHQDTRGYTSRAPVGQKKWDEDAGSKDCLATTNHYLATALVLSLLTKGY